jgi:hypothetical protein
MELVELVVVVTHQTPGLAGLELLIQVAVVVLVQVHLLPQVAQAVQALSFFATPAQFNILLVAQ